MESRVIWDSPIPGMHPVVTVEEFFRSGEELITLHWSHEICFCKERLLLLPVADPCTFRGLVRFSLIGGTPLAECCVWLTVEFTLNLEGDVVAVADWYAVADTDEF